MAEPTITLAQAYAYARAAGFGPAEAVVMAAIAKAESGLRIGAYNPGTPGHPESSGGVTQINVRAHPWADLTRLRADPAYAFAAAFKVYVDNGRSFRPWSVFSNGSYRGNVSDATSAANSVETGVAQGGPGAPGIPAAAAQPAGFHLPGPLDAVGNLLGKTFSQLNPLKGVEHAAQLLVTGTGRLMLQGILVTGGVVLVVLGVNHAVAASPAGKAVREHVDDAAGAMAAAG